MNKMRKLAVLGLLFLAGCSDQDTRRLAEVGRVTARKLETLTGGSPDQWQAGLARMSAKLDDAPIDRRVAVRLRWDKLLADCTIVVTGSGKQVELTGAVSSTEKRSRAVEIAESTAGVGAVIDKIEVAE